MGIKNIIGELRVNGKPVLTEKYSEGLAYELSDDETYYTVTGLGDCTDTDIIIPSTYEGRLVTTIEEYTFEGCDGLNSVVMPDTMTTIGDNAFSGCTGLTSVVIPDSVTTIGSFAFSGCSSLTSIVIPDSVTSIGNYAFDDCSGLTSVEIPDSVTTIDESVFASCTGLMRIVIPDSVTSIGNSAFWYCSSLRDVYYTGRKEAWNIIPVGTGNQILTDAIIHYNYADDFMSVNDRLGDISFALDELHTYAQNILGESV